jgi:hypothetical protein
MKGDRQARKKLERLERLFALATTDAERAAIAMSALSIHAARGRPAHRLLWSTIGHLEGQVFGPGMTSKLAKELGIPHPERFDHYRALRAPR